MQVIGMAHDNIDPQISTTWWLEIWCLQSWDWATTRNFVVTLSHVT